MREYNRVFLKLSGEALAGEKKTGFDEATCVKVAKQVQKLVEDGIQVGVVIGGGNFWRGRTHKDMDFCPENLSYTHQELSLQAHRFLS